MKGFIINPVRTRKFHHTIIPKPVENAIEDKNETVGDVKNLEAMEPIEFSVTFDFVVGEDIDYVALREKMEDKKDLVTYDENNKETRIEAGIYNAFLYTLRTSLVGCEGILLPDGNPIVIRNENGKINESYQKAVFEGIRTESDLFDKITLAYQALNEKN